jgi:inner membrane protein
MQAPTHATFGLVFVIGTGTVLGVVLTPPVAAFAVLGALLPDVDTPTSLIGKLCLPLARLLERRFGHRTVTHSLLGLALFTGPLVSLGLINPQWPLAFGLGYLSHLLIDCANKSGTPLFYPSPIRAVLPRSEALRIAVGSGAETVLGVVLAGVLVVLVPLHQMGFARALHAFTRTTSGAITDFRSWEGRYEVWADVDGLLRLSQRRVRQRYRVLGIANASTLIVRDPATGTIHTVGPTETANIYPSGIRAHQGAAVRVRTRQVTLTQQLLKDLLREVPPDGETYFHGIVRTPDAVVLKPDPEAYDVLKAGLHEVELRFARQRDLEEPLIGNLFVLSGLVLVQTIRPAEHPGPRLAPTSQLATEFDDVTELFVAHLTDPATELLVREGERVTRGQLLARLRYRDPEAARRRQHAEALVGEHEAALGLQAAKLRQAEALVAGGLAAPGAVDRERAALLRAEETLAQARRALVSLADEARRLAEIRAPVDGQVLTLRVHVVHGNEGTAQVRLLYRRPSPPGDGAVYEGVRVGPTDASQARRD